LFSVINDRRRRWRLAGYELTLRGENDNAIILVDIRQSFTDDLVQMTLIEVIGGHVQVTFVARNAASWDNGKKVILRSRDVNIADGDWHHIEITRYNSYICCTSASAGPKLGLQVGLFCHILCQ